jgi:solute carrier family 31 (copper transporter), member 1
MFAGSCIAVALLAMSLSLLRRMSHEYDKRIIKDHERRTLDDHRNSSVSMTPLRADSTAKRVSMVQTSGGFRPHFLQQMARGILHLSQFVVAYFTMLIFMLLNGYLIFSIVVGIFLGYMLFEWETVDYS